MTSGMMAAEDARRAWATVPFWVRFRRVKRISYPHEKLLSVYREHGVVRKSDRDDNFNKASDDLSTYQLVTPGDLVVNKMKAWQGSMGISAFRGIVSPAYYVFQQITPQNPRYLDYLLRSQFYTAQFAALSKGIRPNQWDLDSDALRRVPVMVPPSEVQQAIADFLDRETAEIDAFIADQECLIELLAERKRLTLITLAHSVSAGQRGLKLGWISRVGNGSTPSRENANYWADEGFPWLNSAVVNLPSVVESDQFVTPLALKECHLPVVLPGSVLVGITGQGKTRGMATLLNMEATINQHLAYITPDPSSLRSDYLLFMLTASYSELRRISEASGSTKGALTCEDIKHFIIGVPSLDEQEAIAKTAQQRSISTDLAIEDARRAIELSKERRSALISAAVTGQLDVAGKMSDLAVRIGGTSKESSHGE